MAAKETVIRYAQTVNTRITLDVLLASCAFTAFSASSLLASVDESDILLQIH